MGSIHFDRREILGKIVYYGPGMSGKTTNLQAIHKRVPNELRGDLTSLATQQDRTLFFDLLPMEIGKINGFSLRLQLYTVPGQIYYKSSRRIVLQGVDGIVFVADSQQGKLEENLESLQDLRENLNIMGIDPDEIPLVLQFNKRDLAPVHSTREMAEALARKQYVLVPSEDGRSMKRELRTIPYSSHEAVAVTGLGVFNTLKDITSLVVRDIKKAHLMATRQQRAPVMEEEPAPQRERPKPSRPQWQDSERLDPDARTGAAGRGTAQQSAPGATEPSRQTPDGRGEKGSMTFQMRGVEAGRPRSTRSFWQKVWHKMGFGSTS